MNFLLLTKSTGFLGWIANFFGYVMNAIFEFCSLFGIQNIGLCIILFTIITKSLMIPMTINQQKSSKLMNLINPEMQAITAKYKDKKDQESMMKQQQETRELYEKYGISPMGGCLPLLIQMPILFALYRIIYNIPAYVTGIKDQFMIVVEAVTTQSGYADKIMAMDAAKRVQGVSVEAISGTTEAAHNLLIDIFNKFGSADWQTLYSVFPGIEAQVSGAVEEIHSMNSFLFGLNMADNPSFAVPLSLSIPILSGLLQWVSTKLMNSSQQSSNDKDNPAASTMKTMTTIMPLMSVFFCFMVPNGVGLYWVATSVVTIVQQLFINSYMEKVNVNELIAKNLEKKNKKRAKKGLPPIRQNSTGNSKEIGRKTFRELEEENRQKMAKMKADLEERKARKVDHSDQYSEGARKGSIAARANMVKEYNEKHNK